MVKMAIYIQKCEQKLLKINNRGGWNKEVLGGKKNRKINNRGWGAIIRNSRVLKNNDRHTANLYSSIAIIIIN